MQKKNINTAKYGLHPQFTCLLKKLLEHLNIKLQDFITETNLVCLASDPALKLHLLLYIEC